MGLPMTAAGHAHLMLYSRESVTVTLATKLPSGDVRMRTLQLQFCCSSGFYPPINHFMARERERVTKKNTRHAMVWSLKRVSQNMDGLPNRVSCLFGKCRL